MSAGPHPDPNRVVRYPEHGVSVTAFEQAIDACANALLAAGYPSDTDRRRRVAAACSHLGIDYIEAIASLVEHTGASPEQARWHMVDYLGRLVGEMRAAGAVAREGISQAGRDVDALGNEIDPED